MDTMHTVSPMQLAPADIPAYSMEATKNRTHRVHIHTIHPPIERTITDGVGTATVRHGQLEKKRGRPVLSTIVAAGKPPDGTLMTRAWLVTMEDRRRHAPAGRCPTS